MSYTIPEYKDQLPRLTTSQMIEVDRLMMEDFQIELIQMMENAGRCLAILAIKRFLREYPDKKAVVILAGTGGNGGGAMVCARRLAAWGCEVEVYLTNSDRMTPVARHQLDILRNMGLVIRGTDELPNNRSADLIIDGVIGYSLKGNPAGSAKMMINWANLQKSPVIALDTPSGVDLTSGTVHVPAIKAEATLTLALPKQGLYHPSVKPLRGELYLGDISVPPYLYACPSLGLQVDALLFREGDVLKID